MRRTERSGTGWERAQAVEVARRDNEPWNLVVDYVITLDQGAAGTSSQRGEVDRVVDDVRVYERALSAQEVLTIFDETE